MTTTGAGSYGAPLPRTDPESVASRAEEPEEPGLVTRWIRRDPVRAGAAALILIHLAIRTSIAVEGFYSQDEFYFASHAAESKLTVPYLMEHFNNHLMPGAVLVAWLITHATGLAMWPYSLIMIAGEAAVGVSFYRLLRLLVPGRWGLLVPLCMLLFSPLTLEGNALWVVGLYILPTQLAMIWAMGSQIRYARTRRWRHQLSMVLALTFGLVFSEKTMLVVPLIFLLTACLLVSGNPLRAVWRALKGFWLTWLTLAAVTAAYSWLYLSDAQSTLRSPGSPSEVASFARNLTGQLFVPGLLGGPWRWAGGGDGPPIVATPRPLDWLSWALLAGLIIVTIRRRPVAARAWTLLLTYLVMLGVLLAATRLGGPLSPLAGLSPRYVSDAVVVAALCVAVALLGRIGDPAPRPLPVPPVLREPGAVAVGAVVAVAVVATLSIGAAFSTAKFSDIWVHKAGRTYLHNAQADLKTAPPGTVFFDQPVPQEVVAGFFYPYNLQSRLFAPLAQRPVFVTEATTPSAFDSTGHIRPMIVNGAVTAPGPIDCGYVLGPGQRLDLPLGTDLFQWDWVVRVIYLSDTTTTARLSLGSATRSFPVQAGLGQYFFVLTGHGSSVSLTLDDPDATMCVGSVAVGLPGAQAP